MRLELVVLIGVPCSGKTTLAKSYFSDHEWVNLDTIHAMLTQDGPRGFNHLNRKLGRSIEHTMISSWLSQNRSVVIDNTNLTQEDRAKYFPPAYEFGAEQIAIYFPPDRDGCVKRNWKRKDETGIFIPNDYIYESIDRIEHPTIDEGFTEIRNGSYLLKKEKK